MAYPADVIGERSYPDMRTGVFDNPIPLAVNCVNSFVAQFYHRILRDGQGVNVTGLMEDSRESLRLCGTLTAENVAHILGCAFIITIIRYIVDFLFFKRLPVWLEANKENAAKMPESCWKCSLYLITWFWAVYIVVSRPYLFFDPATHWNDWKPGLTITTDIYWLYIVQMGFYLHCVYATLFIETRRKDFLVLMIHHFLTLSLLLFSISVRFHKVGLMVLLLHDIGDVMLEMSKVVVYCRYRGNEERKYVETAANVLFLLFAVQWVLFRLYWFPIKVLYSTAYVSLQVYPEGPFYIVFNIMLMLLYAMQVYWFTFIISLIIRVMLGGKVEDIREDEDKEPEKVPKAAGNADSSEDTAKPKSETPKTRKRKQKAGTS